MRRCAFCKSEHLAATDVDEKVEVGARVFSVSVPATVCGACGESYVSADTMKRLELTVAAKLVELGDATGASFRYLRKALGLRATDLASLLDVTSETISRWETGKVPLDRCSLASLATMASDQLDGRSTTLAYLRALRDPPPARRRLRLALAGPPRRAGSSR